MTDADLVEKVGSSVWRVESEGCGARGSGSAWAIDERHLVTNWHVVNFDSSPRIRSRSGKVLAARVIGSSTEPDIAVLEVSEDLGPTLAWAEPSDLKEGQHVVGLGYPVPGTDFSATPGSIVSFQMDGATRAGVRTDAALDHGNSGGPLLTAEGLVAGVTTQLADNRDGVQTVPVAFTKDVLSGAIGAMLAEPTDAEVDCAALTGAFPSEDYDYGDYGDYYDEYEYPEVDVPEYEQPVYEPPTTAAVVCPTGVPTAAVTTVEPIQDDPEYLPDFWTVTVSGTVRNDSSAGVTVYSVDVDLGDSYPSSASIEPSDLAPGQQASFTMTSYIESAGPPSSAQASLSYWSWSDYELYDCPAG